MRDRRYSGTYGRVLIVLALGFVAGLVLPVTCHGQSLGQRAESFARSERERFEVDQIVGRRGVDVALVVGLHRIGNLAQERNVVGGDDHAPNIAHSVPKYNIALPLGATLLGYVGGIWDHDAGGYRDSFRFAPDKQAHLLASVVLSKAVADGTSVKLGFATCLLAGAAWEAGQRRHHGYASGFDFTYDSVGCLAGALWGRK